jgi:hypothetical protein
MKAALMVAPTGAEAAVGLVLAGRGFDVRLRQGDVQTLATVFGLLSGAFTVDEIAARAGLAASAVSAVVGRLAAHGLVYDYAPETPNAAVDRAALVDAFDALAAALRFDLFRHELFEQVEHDERMFLAAAAEYFHLIRDAPDHTARAVEHAPPELVPILEAYRCSEQDHHVAIGVALQQALGGAFDIAGLCPLAATEAVILKTHRLAERDALAYAACCAFAESRAAGTARVKPAAASLWRPQSRGLLEALAQHAAGDRDAAHAGLFATCVEAFAGDIAPDHAGAILTAVHEFKHYLDNMNFEILRTNSRPGALVPRLRPRLADYGEFDE